MTVASIISDLPPLKHDDLIGLQVTDLQLASLLDDVRMFTDQQPADVSKEKPSHGVVRVGVRLRVLVVNAMIT